MEEAVAAIVALRYATTPMSDISAVPETVRFVIEVLELSNATVPPLIVAFVIVVPLENDRLPPVT